MQSRDWAIIALGWALLGCDATLGVQQGEGTGEEATQFVPRLKEFNTVSELRAICDDLGNGPHPGPAPLRRLTRAEYNSTVADLLGDESNPGDRFPPEARALGFHGVADGQNVSVVLAEDYQSAAQDLAVSATADLDGLLGCDPEQAACVEDFISEIGGAAYRRPMTDAEVARLVPVFEWGRDNQSVTDGVQMVLEVLLQSPDFLYRPEFGEEEVGTGVVRLSSHEIATRLSYLLLGSMPDEELIAAAEADELRTAEQIRIHAERLLTNPRAKQAFGSFHSQWLNLEEVAHIERDPGVYEGYTDEIPELFVEETERFIEHVIFEDDGSLRTLLTAPYTMANATLATFYGLAAPSGDGFEVVTTGAERAGLLSHGSLLAHHAQPLQTSPVHRGKFVRESLLCQFPPPPPADLIIVPPELDPNLTTRERFNQHSADPECAGCHKLMDPIGLGFEHFDPVGRFRADENGIAVSDAGELFGTDVDGEFNGPVELGARLASSEQVAGCMTRQWVRFAHGRSETGYDACSLAELGDAFLASDYDIKQLVLALTQTDAFLYREEVTP